MTDIEIDGVVFYSDGSCIPNPGNGGWGLHGYTFSKTELPKKPTGAPHVVPTEVGYVFKFIIDAYKKKNSPDSPLEFISDSLVELGFVYHDRDDLSILHSQTNASEVGVIQYLDFFGPLGDSTNNVAELTAFIRALEYAKRENIRNVIIHADSQYVLKGFQQALPIWAKNNWTRRDGNEIKNRALWETLYKLQTSMTDFHIEAHWMPGHSIFLGNNLADENANLGKNATIGGFVVDSISVSDPVGYWKEDAVIKHPLLCHQKLFFNGDYEYHSPGRYFLGAVDKDIGLLGKKLSDTSYSVLLTQEPIEDIDNLILHHCRQGGNTNEPVVAHLNNFFRPRVFNQFQKHGIIALYQESKHQNDLSAADKSVVTECVRPPKKAFDAFMSMNNLLSWLTTWLNKDPGFERFVVTDLTPHLYESATIQKKKKDVTVTRLHSSIVSGTASIEVDANFRDSEGKEYVLPTILSLAIDLPDRNGLKRIEDSDPKVTMLSWEESHGVFRYFTIVQTQSDVAAYCGYYSNTRLNRPVKSKAK